MLNEPIIAGLRERLLLIRRVNSFGRLNDQAMLLIAEHARVRSFADGALALREGGLEHVHIVASGGFTVTRFGQLVTEVGPGGAIGAMSAAAHDSHGVTARSVGPSRTLEIPIDVFLTVNEESFPVLRVGLRVFSQQLLDAHGHDALGVCASDPGGPGPVETVVGDAGSMELVEKVIELSERGMFRSWNANALFDIAGTAREVHLAAGDALWRAGEPSTVAYHVIDGQLACDPTCLRGTVGAGSMLGLLEMLGERPHEHTLRASTECRTLALSLEHLVGALDTHRDLAMQLVATLARGLLPGPAVAVAA